MKLYKLYVNLLLYILILYSKYTYSDESFDESSYVNKDLESQTPDSNLDNYETFKLTDSSQDDESYTSKSYEFYIQSSDTSSDSYSYTYDSFKLSQNPDIYNADLSSPKEPESDLSTETSTSSKLLTDFKFYTFDPNDSTKTVDLDSSYYTLTESGDESLYNFNDGVKCTKIIFGPILLWQYDPNEHQETYPKSVVYNKSTIKVAINLEDVKILFEKDDQGEWVFTEHKISDTQPITETDHSELSVEENKYSEKQDAETDESSEKQKDTETSTDTKKYYTNNSNQNDPQLELETDTSSSVKFPTNVKFYEFDPDISKFIQIGSDKYTIRQNGNNPLKFQYEFNNDTNCVKVKYDDTTIWRSGEYDIDSAKYVTYNKKNEKITIRDDLKYITYRMVNDNEEQDNELIPEYEYYSEKETYKPYESQVTYVTYVNEPSKLSKRTRVARILILLSIFTLLTLITMLIIGLVVLIMRLYKEINQIKLNVYRTESEKTII